jgi:hypothetical protein
MAQNKATISHRILTYGHTYCLSFDITNLVQLMLNGTPLLPKKVICYNKAIESQTNDQKPHTSTRTHTHRAREREREGGRERDA